MAGLGDKVQNALNESRTLVLGVQVLLGFQYRAVFERGFETLPRKTHYLHLVGLGFLLVTLALLLVPASYHLIVNGGEDTPDVHRFTTRVIDWALLPFAVALGLGVHVSTARLGGDVLGLCFGLGAALTAIFFWYGIEIRKRRRRGTRGRTVMEEHGAAGDGGTPLKDKIRHVLTETRVVLPGAQALLGFQLAVVQLEGFEQLSTTAKYVHLASLSCVLLSTILLMTPAAYHRLVERGEETAELHHFAGRALLAAMAALALGICGDLLLVVRKVTGSTTASVIVAGLAVVMFHGLWFGLMIHYRRRRAG
ncbi:MAG: DUF6328 family protein [Minicystis sp.]